VKIEPVTTSGNPDEHARKLAARAAYRKLRRLVERWHEEEQLKRKLARGVLLLLLAVAAIGVVAVRSLMPPGG
jgi:hypothetical protein